MRKLLCNLISCFCLAAIPTGIIYGQSATGTISGTVTDESGAVIPNSSVAITNKASGTRRTAMTNQNGIYSAPGLEAGQYTVRSELQGFKTLERDAEVVAGGTTTVNMGLTLGTTSEVVNVSAANAELNYESHTISGVVEHESIENLPLNGRSFLQLASLEPGVQVVVQAQGVRNAPIGISILGGGGQYALVTMDGLSIADYHDGYAGAGTSINFSQEVVEEFQLSSATFDLSTGTTMQGAVNLVTRSGGNGFHGSGFFFYRDHNMAAYPGLKRNPFNPNPFFARRNPGGTISGPIIKNKLFFFGSEEYINQAGVVTVQPDLGSIAGLAGVFPTPFDYHYTTVRFDYQPTPQHTLFLRWTNDKNTGFGVTGGAAFPSAWVSNYNWSDQIAFGITSTLSTNVVSEFRFGYRMWENNEAFPTAAQCSASCLGGPVPGLAPNGLPQLTMQGSANFMAGNNGLVPQNRIARNFEPHYTLSWQKGKHSLKFGGDLDMYNEIFNYPLCQVGCMGVYSVETTKAILGSQLSAYAPNLPNTIRSTEDLLNLPIYNPAGGLIVGFEAGPPITPGPWHFNSERRNFHPRGFAQDTWKLRPNFTLNYGLAYTYESGIFPSDMPIPGIEGPIYGLAPGTQQQGPQPYTHEFSPVVGFAYSPGKSGKTVIRGGGGVYWDTGNFVGKLHNQAYIGPVGNGPIHLPSTLFVNTFPGVVQQGPGGSLVPLPVGAPLPSNTFTSLTLGQFLSIYSQQYAALNAHAYLAQPLTKGAYTYSNLDLVKAGTELYNPNTPIARSYQTSLGIQRELGHDMVLTADWVRRQTVDANLNEIDLNHYNEFINGVQTPVIPKCTPSQFFVLGTQCSTGSFSTYVFAGRAVYEGLLVKLNKRLSKGVQFTASYALQNQNTETVVNLNNYMQGYGPNLPRHNLNVSGIINLAKGFSLSLNSSIISRTPVAPVTTGIDLSGTGAAFSGPLPGVDYRCFAMGCGKSDLQTAVNAFNTQYAGQKAPNGAIIPKYVLPADYQFGDPTFSQDFRLTKVFAYKERVRLSIYAEMFNAFNIANLTGYGFNLDTLNPNPARQAYAFGQPTQRAGQVFLSSGPRAEQFGTRITF